MTVNANPVRTSGYADGKQAFLAGLIANCPMPPADDLKIRIYRRAWYDGYYDAKLSAKYYWWNITFDGGTIAWRGTSH